MFEDNKKTATSTVWVWKFLKYYLPGAIGLQLLQGVIGYQFEMSEFILISLLLGATIIFWFRSGQNKNYRILSGIFAIITISMIVEVISKNPTTGNQTGNAFTIIVTGNSVNIRSNSSLNGVSLGSARRGDRFRAYSLENGYYLIDFNNGVAYISAEYSKKTK